jgi:LmbE family N-acetylglucosaminyl deacetylase
MKPFATFALCLTLTASAQQTFTDPANLRGERVRPLDGRELSVDQGATGLQQLLRKLNTRASILNIVAHPDDEDGGMLTLYSRGVGARVADLSLTRGEGGQNAMTGDFEDALGLLRTQELLANDRYTGVDQMFGTEVDFGFSKTKEEAFAKWTHDRVLYDAVRAVRLYRPLVIVSTWTGNVTDGHGQHQVSGEIAQEVFNKAGDPKVFPEMITEGLLPWQPLKVYARVPQQAITDKGLFDYATGQYTPAKFTNYVTGEVSTTPPSTDVVVDEGEPDPLLAGSDGKPLTYVQFARIGLGLQRSQIPSGFRMPPPGRVDINYHRYGSRLTQQPAHEDSFFDGIDISIEGIATLAPSAPKFLPESLAMLRAQIAQATTSFDPTQPASIAPLLAECLHRTDILLAQLQQANFDPTQHEEVLNELRVKRVQINVALTLALGLTLDATTHGADQVAGSSVQVWTTLRTASPASLSVERIHLVSGTGEVGEKVPGPPARSDTDGGRPDLTADHADQRTLTAKPAFTLVVTRPYFFRDNIESPVYQLKSPALRNAPATPPALIAWATVNYHGIDVEIGRVVHDGPQAVSIVPPASITILSHAEILPSHQTSLLIPLNVSPPGARVEGEFPDTWKVTPDIEPKQSPPGFKQLRLSVPIEDRQAATLHAIAVLPNKTEVREGYRPVGYGDLPRTNYFTPAADRIVPVDLKLPAAHRVAYLPGTGDAVPEALASIGLQPEMLTVADLTPAKLAEYNTVILGVRTYSAHPDLHGAPTQALLDYAKNGGNVVVQYQTAEFTADDAPYPLSLGRDAEKVVDETDAVKLTDANSPLLATPNRITSADFNGWIEERGHGFLHTWDDRYTALTETHDPGQDPQRGGLVTVSLGKGRWTYVAFALYRQLPEAVPGAYRLFVNLLSK